MIWLALHLAGIAPRPVPMASITAAELTDAIRTTLELPEGPQLAAAERLRAGDERAEIVRRLDMLVAVAEKSGPVTTATATTQ